MTIPSYSSDVKLGVLGGGLHRPMPSGIAVPQNPSEDVPIVRKTYGATLRSIIKPRYMAENGWMK